jgi:hypothetical protein
VSDLVWDFKPFVYGAVVGLASGVVARGESGSSGDGTEDSESSGVREGGADADSANVLRLRQRRRQT